VKRCPQKKQIRKGYAMSNLKSVTEQTFDAEVTKNNLPVLVDFWAEWCAPCKALSPTLSKLSERFRGNVDFVKVNIDENTAVRDRFSVRGIPTLILMRDGQEVGRVVGNRSAAQLAVFIDSHLGTSTEMPAAAVIVPEAFRSNAQEKEKLLGALRSYLEKKRATPTEVMWEGEIGSAVQFVTNTTDQDESARFLGIPVNLIAVVEALSTYRSTRINGAEFCAKWLDVVPVGANLTRLPTALLIDILRGREMTDLIGEVRSLLSIRELLAAQHTEPGSPSQQSELAAIKQSLTEFDPAELSAGSALAVNILTSLCQPLTDPAVITDFISAVAGAHWKLLRLKCNWNRDDDVRLLELAEQTSNDAIARGEPPSKGDTALDRVAEVDPELIRRFRFHYDEGYPQVGIIGSGIGDRLIELTTQCA
jgi:thioredoxin